jgi:hypothetical protein
MSTTFNLDEALFTLAFISAGCPAIWPVEEQRKALRDMGEQRFSQPIDGIPVDVLAEWLTKARRYVDGLPAGRPFRPWRPPGR